MAGPRKSTGSRSGKTSQRIGRASSYTKPTARAAARRAPISITRGGKKTSITGSRSVAAQSIRRGSAKPAAAKAKAKSAGGGLDIPGAIGNVFRSIVPQDKLITGVGNRIKSATKR